MNILVAFLVTNRISHIPVQCVSGGQAWTLKTCPTRTFIGMRTVLSAEGVRPVQWKSHLQLRTPSYFVQAAMMQNLLAGAMPVVTLSDQVNYFSYYDIQSNLTLRNFLVTTKSSLKSKVPYFKHLTKVPYKVYLTRNQGKIAIFWNQYFY